MSTTTKKQSLKLNNSGSLHNWLMAHNSTVPEVGKGATILMWSDRKAYQVIEVNADGTEAIIQRCRAKRIDNLGPYSDSQDYDYSELTEEKMTVAWRKTKWCVKYNQVNFVKTYEIPNRFWEHPDHKLVYTDTENLQHMAVVPGITKMTTKYEPVNIIFGMQKEYYDPTF